MKGKLFFVVIFLVFVPAENRHRTKRKVVFTSSSRFFFRLNGKENMLNYTELFAHGWTFRINYELPTSIPKRHQFFKRDVRAELDTISDETFQTGYSCVLKYLCETVETVKPGRENCGILCGLGEIISSANTMESALMKSFLTNCDYHIKKCPYVFSENNVGFG